MGAKWFEKSYRRNLVDMHIEDWDPAFLSKFDPKTYVEMLKRAEVQSAMIYANSHVGYCYWPTKLGKMHSGIKGRDILGEVISLSRQNGMDVIVYFTLIYDNWAYDHDPSWRIVDVDGKYSRDVNERSITRGRYGVCCPNSPGYREYLRAQLSDLGTHYDFDGMFLDMTFWPTVCYCPSCQKRYSKEVGGTIPRTIDWENAEWVRFQEKREEWIGEFAEFATRVVKSAKPSATVDHQFSTSLQSWVRGSTEALAAASDYCGGDFYEGFFQQSFICKLFHSTSHNRPFEFHTSRCYPNLSDHTTMKSEEGMRLHASIALAHGGAFLFIDAIDPLGTVNPEVYDLLGSVFRTTKEYESHLGGELCQDVAVYFSFSSKMDLRDNGKKVFESKVFGNAKDSYPHLQAAFGAARALKSAHIPYGVISRANQGDLGKFKLIVLPDVTFLNDEERAAFERYVEDGGSLYASGTQAAALLSKLIGVTAGGETAEAITYVSPTAQGKQFFPGVSEEYPLMVFAKQAVVQAYSSGDVLATTTLPFTDPADTSRFASIHSDPPGRTTSNPAAVLHSHGKGRVFWISSAIEAAPQPPHKRCFDAIVKRLMPDAGLITGTDLPSAVEIVAFHQPHRKRYALSLVNIQEETPVIPIAPSFVELNLGSRRAARATLLPTGERLKIVGAEGAVRLEVPGFRLFAMLSVEYA